MSAHESESESSNDGILTPCSSQSDSDVGVGLAPDYATSPGVQHQLAQLSLSPSGWQLAQKRKKKRPKTSVTALLSSNGSSYFNQFTKAGFSPEPTAPIEQEFKRLAAHMKWRKTFVKHRDECYARELEYHSCIDLAPLVALQLLCTDLGIKTPPSTITQCKKVGYKAGQQLRTNNKHD